MWRSQFPFFLNHLYEQKCQQTLCKQARGCCRAQRGKRFRANEWNERVLPLWSIRKGWMCSRSNPQREGRAVRKVFEVFSEKISLICFGTLFLFFVKTSVTTSTNFFLRTPNTTRLLCNLLFRLLRVFFFFVVKEESSSSYKKREKKKNDERWESWRN